MVYEWGAKPETGYPEEIGRDAELKKGDLILCIDESSYPFFVMPGQPFKITEKKFGDNIKKAIAQKRHKALYVKVEYYFPGISPGYWIIKSEFLFQVLHESPLTGLEVLAIIVLAGTFLGITLAPYIMPILYKWTGISPEELKEYKKGMPLPPLESLTWIILFVVIGVVALTLFKWKR